MGGRLTELQAGNGGLDVVQFGTSSCVGSSDQLSTVQRNRQYVNITYQQTTVSMTKKRPSYTARELEEETGFDRRTIAYYVQEGLLPRVGRRGPRTRYPGLVRDRLLFIRRVREAEEAGEVSAVSLSDMRVVFERVSPGLIARVADGEIAVTPELVERASTAFRLPEMRRAVLERRVMCGRDARKSRGFTRRWLPRHLQTVRCTRNRHPPPWTWTSFETREAAGRSSGRRRKRIWAMS